MSDLYALIEMPISERDMFGKPTDFRLEPTAIHFGTIDECIAAEPDRKHIRLQHNEQGREYWIARVLETDLESEHAWDVAERYGDPQAMAETLFSCLPIDIQKGWQLEAAHFCDEWNQATAVDAWIQNGDASNMQVYDAVSYATLRDKGILWVQAPAEYRDALVQMVMPNDAAAAVREACKAACLEEDGTADERYLAAEHAALVTRAALYNIPYSFACQRAARLLQAALQELEEAPESSARELICAAHDIFKD